MYLICGLGNPGILYEHTRHNMGFLTIDELADRIGISVNKAKFKALLGEGRIGSEKVILVKPQTFMNLSGEALKPLMDFYKLPPENLIVIYDDIDLPLGRTRVRRSGSSGSHNGMRSVVGHLQFENFPRVRIGLGSRGPVPLDKFVIGHWTDSEEPALKKAIQRAADACEIIVREGIDQAMNKCNSADPSEKPAEASKEKTE